MTQTIITYLIISLILMGGFLIINEKEIRKSYVKFENKRNESPTNGWYTFYILTHVLKAPILAPSIALLVLLNGGKLLPED